MKWTTIFACVTAGALAGMLMGGLFGLFAGSVAPKFFAHVIPWNDVEPRGIGTVFGSTVGVLLGGGLAVFGVMVQLFTKKKD